MIGYLFDIRFFNDIDLFKWVVKFCFKFCCKVGIGEGWWIILFYEFDNVLIWFSGFLLVLKLFVVVIGYWVNFLVDKYVDFSIIVLVW